MGDAHCVVETKVPLHKLLIEYNQVNNEPSTVIQICIKHCSGLGHFKFRLSYLPKSPVHFQDYIYKLHRPEDDLLIWALVWNQHEKILMVSKLICFPLNSLHFINNARSSWWSFRSMKKIKTRNGHTSFPMAQLQWCLIIRRETQRAAFLSRPPETLVFKTNTSALMSQM